MNPLSLESVQSSQTMETAFLDVQGSKFLSLEGNLLWFRGDPVGRRSIILNKAKIALLGVQLLWGRFDRIRLTVAAQVIFDSSGPFPPHEKLIFFQEPGPLSMGKWIHGVELRIWGSGGIGFRLISAKTPAPQERVSLTLLTHDSKEFRVSALGLGSFVDSRHIGY